MYKAPKLTTLAGIKGTEDSKRIIEKIWKYWKYAYANRNNTCFPLNNYITGLKNKDMDSNTFFNCVNNFYILEEIIPKVFCKNMLSGKESYWNSPTDFYNNPEESLFNSITYRMKQACRIKGRISTDAPAIMFCCMADVYDRSVSMLDEFFDNCKPIDSNNCNPYKNFDNISKVSKNILKSIESYISDLDDSSIKDLLKLLTEYHVWLYCTTWENPNDKYLELIKNICVK